MTNCIYYLSGYCQLQQDHFCEYNNQELCPRYLVERIDGRPLSKDLLDKYSHLEEQERAKRWATGMEI